LLRRNGVAPDAAATAIEGRRNTVERRRDFSSRFQHGTPARYSVYSGQTRTGSIDVIDGVFIAHGASGALVGRFQTLRKAADALGDESAP
jgi:hypothetical protein